jgi:SAM-dependent methyltransferase
MTTTPTTCCGSQTVASETGDCCGPAGTAPRSSDAYKDEYSPSVADKWDQLIDWEHRDAGEAGFFTRILREQGAKTVLDAASGTGYHAWALTRGGFKVTASDGSPEMVRRTRENMTHRGLAVEVYEADWRRLSDIVPGRYDAVLCLGNSFSHLFNEEDRIRTLAEFRSMLAPGGLLLLDHRNYDSILESGFTEKRRSYCCGSEDVKIHPSTVKEEIVLFRYDFPDGTSHEVTQCPLRQDYVTGLLQDAGFESVRRYGDMESCYDIARTDFIIQAAHRPAPN